MPQKTFYYFCHRFNKRILSELITFKRMKTLISISIFILVLSLSSSGQIKVACVGNSITYGYGIKDRAHDSYPAQLAQLLGDKWEVSNFGHSGATLLKNGNKPYWKLNEYKAALESNPDVVIIKLGTNDSKTINWDKYSAEYATDYIELIKSFRELPTKPYIIIGLPVQVVEDKWTIRKTVVEEEITAVLKGLIRSEKTGYIDFKKPLKGHDDLLPDLIHPNEAGAKLMALEAAKRLKKYRRKIEKH